MACWNVENLFDTIAAPPLLDADFTPTGSYHWNSQRYWKKLGNVSRTIAGFGDVKMCHLVGLVEVENDSVLYDLTQRTRLRLLGYEYIASHGPDQRGINVGLLYHPSAFIPVAHDSIRVEPGKNQRPTRDILHVAGILPTNDTLDVFVVHLPSKKGVASAGQYRERIALRLASYADSVQNARQKPLIVIMGDFNSSPSDRIFRKALSSYTLLTKNLSGTYYFRNEWSQIDHFLVNPLFEQMLHPTASVCRFPHLLDMRNAAQATPPFRTYRGPVYQGGISDHLPILLTTN